MQCLPRSSPSQLTTDENAAFPQIENRNKRANAMLERKPLSYHCPIELAVAENTLFALPPINRIVPTTKTKMTASITAYSAISWPSSCNQSLRNKFVMIAPPCNFPELYTLASRSWKESVTVALCNEHEW